MVKLEPLPLALYHNIYVKSTERVRNAEVEIKVNPLIPILPPKRCVHDPNPSFSVVRSLSDSVPLGQ